MDPLSEVEFPLLRLRPNLPMPALNATLVWARETGRSWRNPWAAPAGYLVGADVGTPTTAQMGLITDDVGC